MSLPRGFRYERIERLLQELQYEITRGMMEREVDETLTFRWVVPACQKIPGGVVACEFRTRPLPRWDPLAFDPLAPQGQLRVVK